jgi:hypothetical protein
MNKSTVPDNILLILVRSHLDYEKEEFTPVTTLLSVLTPDSKNTPVVLENASTRCPPVTFIYAGFDSHDRIGTGDSLIPAVEYLPKSK